MDETKVYFGDALKALDENGKIGGYLVRFTDKKNKDLAGEWFDAETYLGARDGDGVDTTFHHGQPLPVKMTSLTAALKAQIAALGDHLFAPIKTTRDAIGIWAETVLDMANEYEAAVFGFVKDGKLGWSSGAVSHLVKVTPEGYIKRWIIGEAAVTPCPCAPQNRAMPIKSLLDIAFKGFDKPEIEETKTPEPVVEDPTLKGMLAEEMAEAQPSYYDLHWKFCEMVCNVAKLARASSETGEAYDANGKLDGLVDEYATMAKPVLKQQVQDFVDGNNEYDFYLKAMESVAPFDLTVSAATKLVKAMERNHSNRTKEGRMLSAANRKKLQACMDSMAELVSEMQGLMDASEPKPKADDKPKSADPMKLRSLRLTLLRGAA